MVNENNMTMSTIAYENNDLQSPASSAAEQLQNITFNQQLLLRKDYRIGILSKVNNIIYCKNDVLAE